MKIVKGKEQEYKDWYEKNSDPYGRACFTYAERWAGMMEEVLGVSAEYLLTGNKKEEYGKWIPVSEGLPTDDDYRYYMVLVENHIEDVPMFCQCDPYYGFGYYREIFDPVSLGYVDTEFNTLEELNYEKALYWMQLPEPPYEKKEE